MAAGVEGSLDYDGLPRATPARVSINDTGKRSVEPVPRAKMPAESIRP